MRTVGAIAVGLALACGGGSLDMTPQPPPVQYAELVGHWEAATAAGHYTLEVRPDGSVRYEAAPGTDGGNVASSQLELPITAWRDGEFDAGVGMFVTTFHIQDAPKQLDGVWKATVDGVVYERLDPVPVEEEEPAVLAP